MNGSPTHHGASELGKMDTNRPRFPSFEIKSGLAETLHKKAWNHLRLW